MTVPPAARSRETAPSREDETAPVPSSPVVLDIGGCVGALVLYAPADLAGTEIEVSRPGTRRTHAVVRERRAEVFAAVYPDLPAGAYTIWRGDTAMGTVQVSGGEVAAWRWPAG